MTSTIKTNLFILEWNLIKTNATVEELHADIIHLSD